MVSTLIRKNLYGQMGSNASLAMYRRSWRDLSVGGVTGDRNSFREKWLAPRHANRDIRDWSAWRNAAFLCADGPPVVVLGSCAPILAIVQSASICVAVVAFPHSGNIQIAAAIGVPWFVILAVDRAVSK